MNDEFIDELERSIEVVSSRLLAGDTTALERGRAAIGQTIEHLDSGKLRVASPCENGSWVTHAWVKSAILLYFKMMDMQEINLGPFVFFDKIPVKTNYKELKVRSVPMAMARFGSFMEPGVVLMPCYVNIGAWIGRNTMIDTWATVGSCAQIGANVHLSGGVGIGGVLEPPSATPVIIEDGCFLGSRCIVVEGVHVGKEAVLAANVTLTGSTPIIDVRGSHAIEFKGQVPARSVVVPGVKEKKVASGTIYTACAYIIGDRKPSTDLKTSLNDVLREFSISL